MPKEAVPKAMRGLVEGHISLVLTSVGAWIDCLSERRKKNSGCEIVEEYSCFVATLAKSSSFDNLAFLGERLMIILGFPALICDCIHGLREEIKVQSSL